MTLALDDAGCHMMPQKHQAIVTAATVNATANVDSLTGSRRRKIQFHYRLSRARMNRFCFGSSPSRARRKDLHAAALHKHFGKRRAKSSGKLSKL